MCSSVNFDAHLVHLLLPLVSGARLVIAEPGCHLDFEYIAQLLDNSSITIFDTVPSLLAEYVQAIKTAGLRCSSLRLLTVGGEQLLPQLAQRVNKVLPATRLWCEYGPTEATIGITSACCPADLQHIVIGRPHANAHCYVVDSHMQLVPPGVPGELLLSGPRLALGYVGRPDLTTDR